MAARVLVEGEGLHGGARAMAMFAVALSVLLSVLDYAIANVALPTIARDIHATPSASIWVINAYQLASVSTLLPLASLGARVGFARMCRIGLATFVVASVLCAVSHTLLELALARALQGMGGACIMSVNIALLRFIYPHAEIGKGISLNGVVVATGVALGPTIASAVLSVATWPWIFLINLPLGGAAMLAALFYLPHTPRSERAFDLTSAVLNVVAFGGVIIGLDSLVHRTGPALAVWLLLAGAGAFVQLARRQAGRPDPMLPIDLLAVPDFLVAFGVGFGAFIASNFFIISMPFTLEAVLHRSAVATGLLITPWPVGIVLIAPFVGRVADRIPAGVLSSIGLCVTGTGFVLLCFLTPDASNLDIAWRIGIAGMGFGIFQPPNNRAMMVSAPRGRSGSASGMVSVARLSGQTMGAMFVALTFGFVVHDPTLRCLELAAAFAYLSALLSAGRLLKPRVPVS
ncbi:MFS transporter [Gluconacetobacter azotocaptans]|uniref:MFS transporter n=1 Tax=Gluconacetobacter azotocaptans TaxID=142834 RepID=A0A7W4JS27_9PROT|nr:MFS transporter [Gluconacetobacter azotocaptans]MBB2189849.1 MFS transporter [Gluconacetobacter azotocaptans]MBM9402690.1 MFS transporter [Gluconacetobacter azotocaptans]GBQ29532.1 transporter [Gluconacetobacter azotocaptans DSM 13594]